MAHLYPVFDRPDAMMEELEIHDADIAESIVFCTDLVVLMGGFFKEITEDNYIEYLYTVFGYYTRYFLREKGSYERAFIKRVMGKLRNEQTEIQTRLEAYKLIEKTVNESFDNYYAVLADLQIYNEEVNDSIAFCAALEFAMGILSGEATNDNGGHYSFALFFYYARYFHKKSGNSGKRSRSRLTLNRVTRLLRYILKTYTSSVKLPEGIVKRR